MTTVCTRSRVIRVTGPGNGPFAVEITFPDLERILGICSKVEANMQVAAQFAGAFDNQLIVVPFGDDFGDLTVSYTSFGDNLCDTDSSVLNGIKLTDAYLKYRLSPFPVGNSNPLTPVKVVLDGIGLRAYLVALRLSATAEDGSTAATAVFKTWLE